MKTGDVSILNYKASYLSWRILTTQIMCNIVIVLSTRFGPSNNGYIVKTSRVFHSIGISTNMLRQHDMITLVNTLAKGYFNPVGVNKWVRLAQYRLSQAWKLTLSLVQKNFQSPNQFDFWISYINFCNNFVMTSGLISCVYCLI